MIDRRRLDRQLELLDAGYRDRRGDHRDVLDGAQFALRRELRNAGRDGVLRPGRRRRGRRAACGGVGEAGEAKGSREGDGGVSKEGAVADGGVVDEAVGGGAVRAARGSTPRGSSGSARGAGG